MRKVIAVAGTVLLSQGAMASDKPTIHDVLANPTPVKFLEALRSNDPHHFKELCREILEPSFYGLAEQQGLGPLKRNAVLNVCQTAPVDLSRAQLKLVKQSAKAEEEINNLKLAHVELKKVTAQKKISTQLAAKIEEADRDLKAAQEALDSMSAVVMLLREDIKEIKRHQPSYLRTFRPEEHEHVTNEDYLDALLQVPSHEFNPSDQHQIQGAHAQLNEAKVKLQAARKKIEEVQKELGS